MRLWILALAGLACVALVGCDGGEKPMSKKDAEDKIFAPTDVNSMSPEMKAKIPSNGLGPAGSQGAPQMPGATPPPNLQGGQASGGAAPN